MNIEKIRRYLASKGWIIFLAIALGAVYAFTNFTFFNEILHSLIKVFVAAVAGTVLRSLAFRKSLGDYPDTQLENDLNNVPNLDFNAERRLRHYWIVTVLCYAVPTLLLLFA